MWLSAVSPELMHAVCQNAAPGFRRVDLGDGDGGGAGRSAWAEVVKSLDLLTFFQGGEAVAVPCGQSR